MKWALIESPDELAGTGEVLTHILPMVEVSGFKTEREAWDFLDRMEQLGNPVITDDEDNVIGTYVGHRLSRRCPCSPTPKESDPGLLVHHQAN